MSRMGAIDVDTNTETTSSRTPPSDPVKNASKSESDLVPGLNPVYAHVSSRCEWLANPSVLGACATESLSSAARAIRVSRGANPQSTAWFPRVSNDGSRGLTRRNARIKTMPTPRFLWCRLPGACATESLSSAARAIRVSRGANPQSTAWFPRVSNDGSRGLTRRNARIKTLLTPRFLWRRLLSLVALLPVLHVPVPVPDSSPNSSGGSEHPKDRSRSRNDEDGDGLIVDEE